MPANKDEEESPHRYSADRPLEFTKDDKLERAEFAERVAKDIWGWHGDDSLVMSLNGEWGSGKSTLNNFIIEKIKSRGNPVIVNFSPWAWSGQDKILEGFFSSLYIKFQETDRANETKHLAERWEALEAWTSLGAEISESIGKTLALVFGGSVTVALITNTSTIPWLHTGGTLLGITGIIASTFFSVFPNLAGRVRAYARLQMERNALGPDQLRKEITKQLKGLHRDRGPVIIVIDDIDRLNTDEIRLLFQLVKVNADFPNLVYLLLFQTDIVTTALEGVSGNQTGAAYLRKIIQVPLDVPQASRALMFSMFTKSLGEIINRKDPVIRWDRKRFTDVFEDNVWPYFKTLRDTKRFLGTFDFYFHGQISQGTLQVNPIDLLIIEVLRAFDHSVYLDIRDCIGHDLPSKMMQILFKDTKRKDRITIEIESIADKHAKDDAHKARLLAILRSLFPDSSGEDQEQAERDLRICHPEHFLSYFQHATDTRATSAANINRLLGSVHDRGLLSEHLLKIAKTKEVDAVFSKIGVYFRDIPVSAAEPFIGALFDVGDALPEAGIGHFNQDPYRLAGRMVYFILKKLPDVQTRVHIFKQCLESSTGITIPTLAMGMLDSAVERKEEPPIPKENLQPLRDKTLQRIKEYAYSGRIWDSTHITLFLYRWRDWDGQEAVNEWLIKELTTPQKKIQFLAQMVNKTLINGSRIEHYLDAKSLEDFINIEDLEKSIESIQDSDLNELERLSRQLLSRAIKQKRAGNSYSEIRKYGDFDPEPEDT